MTARHVDSYYAATAPFAPEHPGLEGATDCDVCVIGGGFTGLTAALELAERGFDVVLIETERIGWGASGRNGGQIVTAYASEMPVIERAVSRDDARRLWTLGEEAKAILKDRVARYAIACDLKWSYLFAANRERHMRELALIAESWSRDYGYGGLRLVMRNELAQMLGSGAYRGALFDPGGGHLHPLNYALGLARAAAAAGVRMHEGTRAVAVEHGARPSVRITAGEVRARWLALCCNAFVGALCPGFRRSVAPVATYIAATEPLGAERATALIPSGAAVSDMNHVLDYYRLSADDRLLFGGRASRSRLAPERMERPMRRRMLDVFPQLADVRFDYLWGGHVAITTTRMPQFGRIGATTYFAHGFSGHGVALTGLAGRLIAEVITGTAERFDLMGRLPQRPFPGGPLLRAPLLSFALLYYRLRDMI